MLLSRGARMKANMGVGCELRLTGRKQDSHYSNLEDTNKDRTTHITEMGHQGTSLVGTKDLRKGKGLR